MGCTRVDHAQLRRAVERVHSLRDFDAIIRALPGAVHAIASVDGRVRAQGSVSLTRQIHYARVEGVTVASDGVDVLADLIGSGICAEHLAQQLLAPIVPWPLSTRPLWRGVESLPGDAYLQLDPDSAPRTTRWWTPPEPSLPLAAGAEALRSALVEAVAARTHSGGTLSADLSGGMDSTSLCFLIGDSGPAHLVTNRVGGMDPAHDDAPWALEAAALLPRAEHLVSAPDALPHWYAGLADRVEDQEGPDPIVRASSRQLAQIDLVAGRGSTRHLTGHGGDELFSALPAYLHSMVRSNPVAAVPHIRATAAMARWKRVPTLRALWSNASFGESLVGLADSLTARISSAGPDFGWGVGVRMPAWASADALDLVRQALRSCATVQPLAPQRGQHAVLEQVRACGSMMRRVDRLTARRGVTWHAPYVDDRVVEAAMSIRLADRAVTSSYKPPLAAAMRGTVPARILGRSTKAEFSAEAYAGLRRHKHELAALCDDLELARLGLVDAGGLRKAVLGLHPGALTMIPLDGTLACESWLRSVPAATSLSVLSGGAR
ncbi:asparagine synthase-related protein [Streptomyces iconiensis]|uniref:asparagine synthase (glutamine-hydrolyzing) n=1 Tax=Streptomyces iconiensis TaxID=1384038 RepID=A0ABT7A0L7_9ACTN|nr:asparagine synthase-related protein [Streptomyces iconiensis]MDJ1134869.1 asparagine synthase-related protein [Streptomyces iconiensis]